MKLTFNKKYFKALSKSYSKNFFLVQCRPKICIQQKTYFALKISKRIQNKTTQKYLTFRFSTHLEHSHVESAYLRNAYTTKV